MAIKIYKRNTAGRRGMSVVKPSNVTDKKPEKSLTRGIKKNSGRSGGKISTRHRGGGARKKYREIDFKMNTKKGIVGRVAAIEKDPNRSALIALINYADGEKKYILATEKMTTGKEVIMDEKTPIKDGNRMQIKNIPVGTVICNVEMVPGKGAQAVRSAGAGATVQAIDEGMATLKFPSTEIRMIREDCYVTIGRMSNFEHNAYRIGKAGRKRHMGRRPCVRGSAMNPVDHPHGGGEGKAPIGMKHPKTPWGKPALGVKTRKKKKASDKLILKRRKKKKRK